MEKLIVLPLLAAVVLFAGLALCQSPSASTPASSFNFTGSPYCFTTLKGIGPGYPCQMNVRAAPSRESELLGAISFNTTVYWQDNNASASQLFTYPCSCIPPGPDYNIEYVFVQFLENGVLKSGWTGRRFYRDGRYDTTALQPGDCSRYNVNPDDPDLCSGVGSNVLAPLSILVAAFIAIFNR